MFQNNINQRLSLLIPRVFPHWANEEMIIRVFHEQHIGKVFKVSISRLSFDTKKNIPIFKATVHFSVWYDTEIAYNFQQRILGEKALARVVYDDPLYWNVYENKYPRRLSKIDKRMMRIAADTYKIQQENFQIQERNAQIEKENTYLIEQQLSYQNQRIQELQDICIANGLEVPFWARSQPPSADVSSMEILSAKTAIAAAKFVLDEPESANDTMTKFTPLSPMGMADKQDMEDEEEDFIPVGKYENDDMYDEWENEDPYDYSEEYYQQQMDEANWR